jgi:hypothetical protein
MAKKFIWKAWLRLNLLTKDVNNDYVAEVSTEGNTKHNEDIAKAIREEGSDLQIETRYANGNTLLKHPRTIVYQLPLKVGTPE